MRYSLMKALAIVGLTSAVALTGATPSQAQWWGPGAVAADGPYPGYYGYAYAPGYVYGYDYGPGYTAYGYAPSYGYWGGTRRPHNPKYDNY